MKTVEIMINEGTQALLLSLSPTASNTMLMVRIFDPNDQFVGSIMSGFNFPSVYFVSAYKATLNAYKHKPLQGIYKMHMIWLLNDSNQNFPEVNVLFNGDAVNALSSYSEEIISDESLWKSDASNVNSTKPMYYKGDLHGHTFLSDGRLNFNEANTILKKQTMDFMAFTEHNLVAMGVKYMDAMLIPSFELTLPLGHINIHGLKEPDIYANVASIEAFQLNEYLENFQAYCHISVNHPFLQPWHFQYGDLILNRIDSLEIICDPTYQGSDEATDVAVSFLDFIWMNRITIFAVGGSDAHLGIDEKYENALLNSEYGDPATYVFANKLTSNQIVEALKKGHTYISRGLKLEIEVYTENGVILPGDCIKSFSSLSYYKIKIANEDKRTDTLYANIIYNGRRLKQSVISNEVDLFFQFHDCDLWVDEGSWHWLRVEIRDSKNKLVSYINPIYSGEKSKKQETWGLLLEAFQKL